MTVVSRDRNEAQVVADRLRAAGIEAVWPKLFDGDFAAWADTGGPAQLVEEFDGPYPNAGD
jgi:rhodanese-related sulfurtransferase